MTKLSSKNIILIATRNQGKLREFEDLLRGEGYRLESLIDHPQFPSLPESGRTLEENARQKALRGAEVSGNVALADDSALEIEALGGKPGVLSARFLGPGASDDDRNREILEQMRDRRGDERAARFRCVLAIGQPDGTSCLVEGECRGLIAEHPRGTGGFGYDPIFYVPALGKTMAELDRDEKNRISHRGLAMERAKATLRILFGPEAEKRTGAASMKERSLRG